MVLDKHPASSGADKNITEIWKSTCIYIWPWDKLKMEDNSIQNNCIQIKMKEKKNHKPH